MNQQSESVSRSRCMLPNSIQTTPNCPRTTYCDVEMTTPTSSTKLNSLHSISSSNNRSRFLMKSKSLFGNKKSNQNSSDLPTSETKSIENTEDQFFTPREDLAEMLTQETCKNSSNAMETEEHLEENFASQSSQVYGRDVFGSQDFCLSEQFGSNPFSSNSQNRQNFSPIKLNNNFTDSRFKNPEPNYLTSQQNQKAEDSDDIIEPLSPISSIHSPIKSDHKTGLTHQVKHMKATSKLSQVSWSTPQRMPKLPKTPVRILNKSSLIRPLSEQRRQNRDFKTPGSIGRVNQTKMFDTSLCSITPNRSIFNNTVNVNIFSPAPVIRSQNQFEQRTPPADPDGSLKLYISNSDQSLDASGDPNNNNGKTIAIPNTHPSLINSTFTVCKYFLPKLVYYFCINFFL